MTPSVKRLDLQYTALQASYWVMTAALCAYQAALLQGRGFTDGSIGTLVAVRYLAGILLQPLIGSWADRHPKVPLKRLVLLTLAVSLCASLVFTVYPQMSFAGTVGVFIIFGGLESSAYPLMDSMAVQFIRAGVPIHYSLGRGIGAFAYAIACVLLGLQAGRMGVESTLWSHALLSLVVMALVWAFPAFHSDAETRPGQQQSPHSALQLLRSNPRFTLMLFGLLFGLIAMLNLSNFLIYVLQAKGGGEEELGVALFLMAASELPGAILFSKLRRRGVGSDRLLVASLFFGALKALALLLAPSLGFIYLAQCLQMLGYGLFTPASVYYVSETVPPEDQVKGQSLMMVFSNGLGGMLSGLIAGRTLDLGQAAGSGVTFMLLSSLACGAVGVLLAFLSLKRKVHN